MSPPNLPAAAVDADLPEVAALEQKLGMLIAHVKVLRATNENLRRDLAAAESRNQALSERVAEAKRRLDSLVARLPEPTE
jgi:outer membrane murein-binding lipoprotein Lpp